MEDTLKHAEDGELFVFHFPAKMERYDLNWKDIGLMDRLVDG